jgi:hypothetical protein
MPFSLSAINEALNGISVNQIRLHSGDPGVNGTDNALGAGTSSASFLSSSGGQRVLGANVIVSGLAAGQSVTWFSIWINSNFRGAFPITNGDLVASSAGEYTLTTGTKLTAS